MNLWCWLRRFQAVLLIAVAMGGPTTLAGGSYQQTSPSKPAPEAGLTSHISVKPSAQTITFDPPSGVTVGTSVSLSAQASSGLTVSFSSNTPSVCTVAGNTVTTSAAGTCTITASQSGDAFYTAAPDVTQSFPVQALAPPTITFDQPAGVTVGMPVSLVASVSPPGLPVLFRSDTQLVCTVPPGFNTATTVAVGTCTITAFQDGEPPRAALSVTRSFQVDPVQVGPARQTITFGQPPGATVGTSVILSAQASSGLPVSFSSGTLSVCTAASKTVTTRAAGTCTITAAQSGSARFAAAPAVTRSFLESSIGPKAAGPPAGLLAASASILAVAAVALTLALRRRRLPPHAPPAPALSVRAVPKAGPPRLVSIRTTGTGATHTVRVEPSPGTSTTTIEEERP